MSKFKFSIVVLIGDVERIIDKSIESLLNQTIGFKDNLQLIFINNNCSDKSLEVCFSYQKRYPENIIVLDNNLSRNDAFEYIQGGYVNFFNIHERLSDDTLKNVYSFFSKNSDVDIVSIPNVRLERNISHDLNYKFDQSEHIVDLIKNPTYFNPFLNSSFIKSSVVKNNIFNNDLIVNQESFFINKILLDNPNYALLNNDSIYYYMDPTEQIPIDLNNHPLKREFLENFINVYCRDLINYSIQKYDEVPKFIQYLLTYVIAKGYLVEEISDIYNKEEYNLFINSLKNVLKNIDDESILKTPEVKDSMKTFLLYLKHGQFNIDVVKDDIFIKANDYLLNKLNNEEICFDYVERKQGFLNIAAFFKSNCKNEFIKVEAVKENDKGHKSLYLGIYNDYDTYRPDVKYLDVLWQYYYNCDIKIPIENNENCSIKIKVTYMENNNSISFYPKISFSTYCNLSEFSHYFKKDSKIILHRNNVLKIIPFSTKKMLKLEFESIKRIFSASKKPQFMYAIFIRIIYLFMYPYMRNKRIWLFSDRPSYADDNAKHLFNYAIKQNDGIEKYFVVRKDVSDYKTMKNISKNVLGFKSLKNKIYYLYAEKIIVSHIIDKYANPLAYRNKKLYCGLSSSDKYFLQHGVIEGDLSDRLNKPMRYLSMFLTSADLERNSIINNHNYNFDENRVPALGLPRFDTLSNEDVKKQILLIPTWRSYIKGEESLLNSEYFHKLKNILINERLLSKMEETGYKLILKLHPELYPYADYFKTDNNNVSVSLNDSYQEFFNKSSILITDYSTVAFDFAYLKKPVIYYQYADEYHYRKGYFDFKTLGFGDVIEREDKLIDKIINYIDDDCKMEDKYVDRVDSFFKYSDDKNNRKRVYEWIYNDK